MPQPKLLDHLEDKSGIHPKEIPVLKGRKATREGRAPVPISPTPRNTRGPTAKKGASLGLFPQVSTPLFPSGSFLYPLPLAEGHTRGPEPVFPSTTCNEALLLSLIHI